MPIVLDDLDKKILHEITSGIHSYDDLAETLKVTRSTIYRRIEDLEKRNLIAKKIMAFPNYELLDLRLVSVNIDASYDHISQCIEILKGLPSTKFLFKCYGQHQVICHSICQKGDEGEIINSIERALKDQTSIIYSVSVAYKWEKVDFTPF